MFNELINWSLKNYSDLPWRKNRSLYGTLISEIMLQQTTVPTVLNKFEKFLEKFPDLQTLSIASDEELMIAWKGLGYYGRARNLKIAANDILKKYKGKIPDEVDLLKQIKGIGEYTANAIVAIGHDKPALSLDSNLERVLCRIYFLPLNKGPKLKKELNEELTRLKIVNKLDKYSPRQLMEALMDLGRTYCQSNKTDCKNCPMKNACKAYELGSPLKYPKVLTKEKLSFQLELLRIIVKKGKKLLLIQRRSGTWLEGQWEIPTFIIKTDDLKLNQYPHLGKNLNIPNVFSFKTNITNYKINNFILNMTEKNFKTHFKLKGEYFDPKVEEQNFTSATLKALKFL